MLSLYARTYMVLHRFSWYIIAISSFTVYGYTIITTVLEYNHTHSFSSAIHPSLSVEILHNCGNLSEEPRL